jgi:hypothetical protein
MKIYTDFNEEIEIKCPCGSLAFKTDRVGYTEGLTCDGCKVFRTIEQWMKLSAREDIFSKEKGLFE